MAGRGWAVTVNEDGLVPVPVGVVTAMGPVVAPAGTVALSWVSEATVNVAAVPLKVTTVAPVKPLPLTVTVDPTAPEDGETPVMAGAGWAVTVNEDGLVPVPVGVVTAVAPVKPLPVRVTALPGDPDPGVTADTTGGDAGAGWGMGSGVAVAPLPGAVPRPKYRYIPASRP